MSTNTCHIKLCNNGKFADTVIMPGDPLRAKYISENYLVDSIRINTVRNMYAYTGMYKEKMITIMASGMGQPSMGIYSYELYSNFGVEKIIRVGSCGAYIKSINLKDIILVQGASTNSSFINQYKLEGNYSILPDWDLLKTLEKTTLDKDIPYHVGNVLSSDIFYDINNDVNMPRWARMGVLAVEMESAALFATANYLNRKAACILTVSDSLVTKEELSPEDREKGFNDMIEITLESCRKI